MFGWWVGRCVAAPSAPAVAAVWWREPPEASVKFTSFRWWSKLGTVTELRDSDVLVSLQPATPRGFFNTAEHSTVCFPLPFYRFCYLCSGELAYLVFCHMETWVDKFCKFEARKRVRHLCFQAQSIFVTLMLNFPAPTFKDHVEFARCPQPLPMGSPSLPISSCELNKNTRRCHQQSLATHLSCRLYQTCDHAVLISGMTGVTANLVILWCFGQSQYCVCFFLTLSHCRWLAAADHVPSSRSESSEVL